MLQRLLINCPRNNLLKNIYSKKHSKTTSFARMTYLGNLQKLCNCSGSFGCRVVLQYHALHPVGDVVAQDDRSLQLADAFDGSPFQVLQVVGHLRKQVGKLFFEN